MRIKGLKALSIFSFILFCFLIFPAFSYGASQPGSGLSAVKSIRYAAAGGVETVTINMDRYDGVNSFYLEQPARFVIDITGELLPDGPQAFEIGTGSVVRIRYSNFETRTARFVIDLSKNAAFSIKQGKGFIKAEATTGVPDSEPVVSIPVRTAKTSADYPLQGSGQMVGTAVGTAGGTVATGAAGTAGGTVATGAAGGAAAAGADGAQVKRTPRPTRIPSPAPATTRRAAPRRSPLPSPSTPPATATPEPVAPIPIITKDEFRINLAPDFTVLFSTKNGVNTFSITTADDGAEKAAIVQSDAPPRLTVSIPYKDGVPLSSVRDIPVNSDVVKSIGITQPEPGNIRISVDIRDRTGVEASRGRGKLTFVLTNKLIPNVGYHKNGERAFFTLYHTALTAGGENLTEFYTKKTSDNGATWTVTFDNERGSVSAGTAAINDDLIKSVEASKGSAKTSLVISAKAKVGLVVFTKHIEEKNVLETTISIIKPAAASERLVVIDAGHGGHDSGAVSLSGKPEKDFNLDIALKLKEQLALQNGLRVYLTRDEDYFVDLYERAMLANELRATLFVSIHNNASTENPDASGIETLFCPVASDNGDSDGASAGTGAGTGNGAGAAAGTGAGTTAGAGAFTSRQFAELTQRSLIGRLRAIDRGIKERPNLVVLRKTDMPAILVEAAFLTNRGDLTNISRSAYRNNVAKSISGSIAEALSLLGK